MMKLLYVGTLLLALLSSQGCNRQAPNAAKKLSDASSLPSGLRLPEVKSISRFTLAGRGFTVQMIEGMIESKPLYSMQLSGDDVTLSLLSDAPIQPSTVDNVVTYGNNSLTVTEKRNEFLINGKLQSLEPHFIYSIRNGNIVAKGKGSITYMIPQQSQTPGQ